MFMWHGQTATDDYKDNVLDRLQKKNRFALINTILVFSRL